MRRWRSTFSALSVALIVVLLTSATAYAGSDFDADGDDDLVVGVPSEGVGQVAQAGAVNVLNGSAASIRARNDKLFTQADLGGTAGDIDRFGNAITYGDFDGDGFDDVAIGAPSEDWRGRKDAGVVHVVFGGLGGLNKANRQLISQAGKMAGANEKGDFLGAVLASGDFNGDGFDDLAIGAPGEDIGGRVAAGAVLVAFGGPSGIRTKGSKMISQKGKVPGGAEYRDAFGFALAVGDFNDDNFDDLAIGTPGEDLGTTADAGTLTVLYGRTTGINKAGALFTQSGIDDVAAGDRFGYALAVGDFNGDSVDDIAVSAEGENVNGVVDAGAVTILRGVRGAGKGITSSGAVVVTQASVDPAENEAGDQLGSTMASGNFDGDKFDDLAIGIPFENIGGLEDAGRMLVVHGSSTGLDPARTQSISQQQLPKTGAEAGDRTAEALRVGNFNGDKFDDIVVASPLETYGGRVNNGLIHVISGSATGLLPGQAKMFHQGTKGVKGKPEAGDRFGEGL